MRQNIQLYFESWLKKFPRHLQRIQKKDFIAPGNHNKGGCASFVHLVTVSQRMSLKPILLSSLERNRTSFFWRAGNLCLGGTSSSPLTILYYPILDWFFGWNNGQSERSGEHRGENPTRYLLTTRSPPTVAVFFQSLDNKKRIFNPTIYPKNNQWKS